MIGFDQLRNFFPAAASEGQATQAEGISTREVLALVRFATSVVNPPAIFTCSRPFDLLSWFSLDSLQRYMPPFADWIRNEQQQALNLNDSKGLSICPRGHTPRHTFQTGQTGAVFFTPAWVLVWFCLLFGPIRNVCRKMPGCARDGFIAPERVGSHPFSISHGTGPEVGYNSTYRCLGFLSSPVFAAYCKEPPLHPCTPHPHTTAPHLPQKKRGFWRSPKLCDCPAEPGSGLDILDDEQRDRGSFAWDPTF